MARTHIRLIALAAFALVAGQAASLPPDDGTSIVVDGSVQTQTHHTVASPVELPVPLDNLGHEVTAEVHTYDLVVPSPVGPLYGAASGALPALPAHVAEVDSQAVRLWLMEHRFTVPWYYMMDDGAIRPYHALFWDTDTWWYLGFADTVYAPYAPEGAPAPPFTGMRDTVPFVHVATAVREVDLRAQVEVLLAAVQAQAASGGFERPDAPLRAAAGSPAPSSDAALGQQALVAAATYAPPLDVAAPGPSPPAEPQALTFTQLPALRLSPSDAAAAGAAGLLLGLALYHLVRKSAILKNRVRGSIAEHVLQRPGSTITEIADAVGVTHQTASYHLRLLQEHGLVIGVERGNKRLYFRNDGFFNSEERGLVAVLRDPESMRVLELIRANPWIMKNEAAAALGVSRNTLNWHLQKLLSASLVSEARENGHCFLFCNRRAADEVLVQVANKVQARAPSESNGEQPSDVASAAIDGGAPTMRALGVEREANGA